jgi:hypothetical protein
MPMTSHDEGRERDHEPRRSAGAELAEAHLTPLPYPRASRSSLVHIDLHSNYYYVVLCRTIPSSSHR